MDSLFAPECIPFNVIHNIFSCQSLTYTCRIGTSCQFVTRTRVVQELMRHAGSRCTVDVYSQARIVAKRQAQQRVVQMMFLESSCLPNRQRQTILRYAGITHYAFRMATSPVPSQSPNYMTLSVALFSPFLFLGDQCGGKSSEWCNSTWKLEPPRRKNLPTSSSWPDTCVSITSCSGRILRRHCSWGGTLTESNGLELCGSLELSSFDLPELRA